MSILIKGEPMPADCWECWAMMSITYNEETCHTCLMEVSAGKGYVDDFLQTGERPEWCPLVEVPSPEEFESKMKDIESGGQYDIPDAHGYADDLMCDTLKKLGYGGGVEIFNSLEKWYE